MDGGDAAVTEFSHSIYINPNLDDAKECGEMNREVPPAMLEEVIKSSNPVGPWRVIKASCGLLASFVYEADASALLNAPLPELLGGPVQVARFSSRDWKNKQVRTRLFGVYEVDCSKWSFQI